MSIIIKRYKVKFGIRQKKHKIEQQQKTIVILLVIIIVVSGLDINCHHSISLYLCMCTCAKGKHFIKQINF